MRHIDYAPIEDFNGYLAACNAVLNLRYPTVGETSGTLLRALGMGKPVMISQVGAFSEYPDSISLKVPVDASEEEHIYEYLKLLIERPEVGRALGLHARAWVERECNWPSVAERYAAFAQAAMVNGTMSHAYELDDFGGCGHSPQPHRLLASPASGIVAPAVRMSIWASESMTWTRTTSAPVCFASVTALKPLRPSSSAPSTEPTPYQSGGCGFCAGCSSTRTS